jgi:hypothetical protein
LLYIVGIFTLEKDGFEIYGDIVLILTSLGVVVAITTVDD